MVRVGPSGVKGAPSGRVATAMGASATLDPGDLMPTERAWR